MRDTQIVTERSFILNNSTDNIKQNSWVCGGMDCDSKASWFKLWLRTKNWAGGWWLERCRDTAKVLLSKVSNPKCWSGQLTHWHLYLNDCMCMCSSYVYTNTASILCLLIFLLCGINENISFFASFSYSSYHSNIIIVSTKSSCSYQCKLRLFDRVN